MIGDENMKMKKLTFIKLLSVVLLCFLVALLTTGCQIGNNGLLPTEPTPEDAFVFLEERKTIIGYSGVGSAGYTEDVVIPSTINGIPVEYIGRSVFYDSYLGSVTLPDTLLVIGEKAFLVNYLNSITIPDSVIEIEKDAFSVNWISSITIGANVNIYSDTYYSTTMGEYYGFTDFYNSGGKEAGTYTYSLEDGVWTKIEE
jgi:hypothetical protein